MSTHYAALTDKEYAALMKQRQRAAEKRPTPEKCDKQIKELRELERANNQRTTRMLQGLSTEDTSRELSKMIAAEKRKAKRLEGKY